MKLSSSIALFVSALASPVLAGHDSWSCVDDTLFETCCVGVTLNNPNATGVTNVMGGGGAIVVGITALGAANADGVPRLACVASAGAYPEITNIADGVLAVGPLTSEVPSVTADRNQFCSQYDPDTIVNFWGNEPVNKTIYGALPGEDPQDTIKRLYEASKVAITEGSIPTGNFMDMGPPIVIAAGLTSPWTTLSCPRLGGPTCPDGQNCPPGFENRGGTEEGNAYYLENAAPITTETNGSEDHDHDHDHSDDDHSSGAVSLRSPWGVGAMVGIYALF